MSLQLFPRPLAGVWTDRTSNAVSVEGVAVLGMIDTAGSLGYVVIARDGYQHLTGVHQVEIVDDQVHAAANRGDDAARGRKAGVAA
jgi:hypothetical protein